VNVIIHTWIYKSYLCWDVGHTESRESSSLAWTWSSKC